MLLKRTLLCCPSPLAFVETGLYAGSIQPALWGFMAITGGGERGGK